MLKDPLAKKRSKVVKVLFGTNKKKVYLFNYITSTYTLNVIVIVLT